MGGLFIAEQIAIELIEKSEVRRYPLRAFHALTRMCITRLHILYSVPTFEHLPEETLIKIADVLEEVRREFFPRSRALNFDFGGEFLSAFRIWPCFDNH